MLALVRVACICRYAARGIEIRACYAVSMGPNGGRFAEAITKDDSSYYNVKKMKELALR